MWLEEMKSESDARKEAQAVACKSSDGPSGTTMNYSYISTIDNWPEGQPRSSA